MADTSNLSNFLEDVADAIRTKKETTEKIPAANFDSEILSITAGIDTSDATATVNDILEDKTAYVNGQKITGTIIDLTDTEPFAYVNPPGGTIEATTPIMDSSTGALRIKTTIKGRSFTGDKSIAYGKNGVTVALLSKDIAPQIGLTPEKIVNGETVFDIVGTGGLKTNDATAQPNDILKPATAYVNGQKITGTIEAVYEPIGTQFNINYTNVNCTDTTAVAFTPDKSYILKISDDIVHIFKLENGTYTNTGKVILSSISGDSGGSVGSKGAKNIKISDTPIPDYPNVYNVIVSQYDGHSTVCRFLAEGDGILGYQPTTDYFKGINVTYYSGGVASIDFCPGRPNLFALSYYSGSFHNHDYVKLYNIDITEVTQLYSYDMPENRGSIILNRFSKDGNYLIHTQMLSSYSGNRTYIGKINHSDYSTISWYALPSTYKLISLDLASVMDTSKQVYSCTINDSEWETSGIIVDSSEPIYTTNTSKYPYIMLDKYDYIFIDISWFTYTNPNVKSFGEAEIHCSLKEVKRIENYNFEYLTYDGLDNTCAIPMDDGIINIISITDYNMVVQITRDGVTLSKPGPITEEEYKECLEITQQILGNEILV